jgi:hypothetical protein
MSEYQRGYAQGFEDGCNFMKTTEVNNEQSKNRDKLRTEVVREEADKRVVQREEPSTG